MKRSGIYRNKKNGIINFWREKVGIDKKKSIKTYWKYNKAKKSYKNNNYWGVMRVKVSKSTDLNRKINGLTEGIKRGFYI